MPSSAGSGGRYALLRNDDDPGELGSSVASVSRSAAPEAVELSEVVVVPTEAGAGATGAAGAAAAAAETTTGVGAAPQAGPGATDPATAMPSATITRGPEVPSAARKKGAGDGAEAGSFWSRLREAYNVRNNLKQLFAPHITESQMPVLDGVRGFCMMWVICTHSWIFLSWNHSEEPGYDSLQYSPWLRMIKNGEMSVDAFFVLSGFLLAHVLLREYENTGTVKLGSFYFRRFMRIAPTYYFVIAVFTPILTAINCENCGTCARSWYMNVLFVNNFVPIYSSCMGWTWSIAVEVQFYVFTPFVVLVFARWRRRGLLLLGALLLLSLLVRALVLYETRTYDHPDGGYYLDVMYIKPYTRVGPYLCGLLLGCVWALYREQQRAQWQPSRRWDVALLGMQLLAWLTIVVLYQFGFGWVPDRPLDQWFVFVWLHRTVWALCVAALLFAALMSSLSRPPAATAAERTHKALPHRLPDDIDGGGGGGGGWLRLRMARWLHRLHYTSAGPARRLYQYPADALRWLMSWRVFWISSQLSYSGYLLHPMWITPFYLFVVREYEVTLLRYWLYCAVNLLVTNAGALLLYLLVERPMMNLRYA